MSAGHNGTAKLRQLRLLQKKIERVAQEWRITFDAARDVIMMLDQEYRILRVNRAATELFNLPYAKVLGQRPRTLLGRDAQRGLETLLARVRRSKQHQEQELYLRRLRFWVLASVDPILDSTGRAGGAVLILRDISSQKQAERGLRRTLEQLRRLSSHLQTVREDERTAIAREIHDQLGHALTGLKLDLSWLASKLEPTEASAHLQRLRSMAEAIDRTIATTRKIATELRPGILDDLGLRAALEWQAEEFAARSAVHVDLDLPALDIPLGRDGSTAVFRIFQESLTNVARHAHASQVWVRLRRENHHLVLSIRDNGQGIRRRELATGRSLGLIGMKERALMLGGELSVEGAPGRGTEVRLRLPVEQPGGGRS